MDTRYSDEDRARIARGWRGSKLAQPAYAAAHGITDRTLRAWIARWAPVRVDGGEAAKRILTETIAQLQTLLANVDLPAPAEGQSEAARMTPVCGAQPDATVPPAPVTPRPTPRRIFDFSSWDEEDPEGAS